ncbi:hypothetical protein HBH98_125940 [Parastagonospora nodorum]|nr:hypothetical protein HBH98_125940 [Parastagonospora nodorum]KAH4375015.1 hypothetical protein HBH97_123090 [Parastagonospora nodorum]KAH4932077.1 hypothetical protein HBI79_106130 [Parastagonospora nodorum]KAH5096679.1 hypothetical protein HBH72_137930 [Parastagonospora nodorum]KAH5105376.1 hypothetical protein HBI73_118780 [Parastagonospora nodorum]
MWCRTTSIFLGSGADFKLFIELNFISDWNYNNANANADTNIDCHADTYNYVICATSADQLIMAGVGLEMISVSPAGDAAHNS